MTVRKESVMYYDYGVECNVNWDNLTEDEEDELRDGLSVTSVLLAARCALRQARRNFLRYEYVRAEDPFSVHCAEEAIATLNTAIEAFLEGGKSGKDREELGWTGDRTHEVIAEMLNGRPWV
jgi:hypothetical protein